MSATSGISVSPELSTAFAGAVSSRSVRFLKISIRDESLILDHSVPPSGTLGEDLDKLPDLLESSVPAYVLARLDDPPTEWMSIFYVPEDAKIRDKMLYASSRNSLTKALGSAPFTDSIYATSKADVNAKAYASHRASLAAPKPMTAREKEMEEIKAAESRSATYDGSRARKSHVGKIGFTWSSEVEQAVKELGETDEGRILILSIDPPTESLVLTAQESYTPESGVGSALPKSDPAYAFCAWPRVDGKRTIAFIYSCPSGSPIKHRMLYSSGMMLFYHQAKALLQPPSATLLQRKIETTDPQELNGPFMREYLESEDAPKNTQEQPDVLRPQAQFARPKGPARKR